MDDDIGGGYTNDDGGDEDKSNERDDINDGGNNGAADGNNDYGEDVHNYGVNAGHQPRPQRIFLLQEGRQKKLFLKNSSGHEVGWRW